MASPSSTSSSDGVVAEVTVATAPPSPPAEQQPAAPAGEATAPEAARAGRAPRFADPDPDAPEVVPRVGGGFPWALAMALGLLAAFEVGLRIKGPPAQIPYALGIQEHRAIVANLDAAGGSARVAVVGSSRAREGVLVPHLRAVTRAETGRSLGVASYAVSGGRADAHEAIVGRLLKGPRKPELILFGICERDVRADFLDYRRMALYWGLKEWREWYGRSGSEVLRVLPVALRNELAGVYHTLRYRGQLSLALRRAVLGHEERAENPVTGGYSPFQARVGRLIERAEEQARREGLPTTRRVRVRERSLANRPQGDEEVKRYVAAQLQVFTGLFVLDQYLLDAVERTLVKCKEAGVKVVLFEVPPSAILRQHLPDGTYLQYLATVRELCARHGVRFVTVNTLELEFEDRDFRDKAHLNYAGARKLTDALARQVAAPMLTKRRARPRR